MKNKNVYMFFILQILIIISNYNNIQSTIFSFGLLDILKVIILIYSSLYIFFIAKDSILKKIIYSGVLFFTYISYLYDNYSVSQLLDNFYYVSSFSFILFYYLNNKFDKFKMSYISVLTLTILDIVLLINHQSHLTIDILIIILVGILFRFYNQYKFVFYPLFLLTLLTAIANNMDFVLFNMFIMSIISIICFRNKRDLIYGLITLFISTFFLIIHNIFSIKSLIQSFDIFTTNINASSFIIVMPLIVLICYMITKNLLKRNRKIEIFISLYISVVVSSLMFISLNNVYNEILIICFAFLIISLIDYLRQDKKLKKEITFFTLHLGYGGIESSTINTANELSELYKVNIVSFYNLKRNIENTINENVKITHLYSGEPNRKELVESIKNKKIIDILSNGFKAIYILFLKQYLVSKAMYECSSMYVVSTRNEFSTLLSENANSNAIKIAQEHMHHRDNKKYINNIKYEFNNIDYMFALTKSLKVDYEKFLKDNKKTKVVIVPNIIYLPKKKSKLKSKNLITISRLNSIKKIEDMIEIFSRIDNKKAKLYIVGDGEELEKLNKKAKDLKISNRVIFTGYKTKEEMEEYILDSSVFLLTSWSEGLPMVLLEAMSYGVPCIAFKTRSGVSDIIDNNVNGFIIDNRNKEKYIEKINELIDNKELLNEFSKKSIEKSKKFTSKEIIKKWQEVLDNER